MIDEVKDLVGHRLPKSPQEAACLQVKLLQEILRELTLLREIVDVHSSH